MISWNFDEIDDMSDADITLVMSHLADELVGRMERRHGVVGGLRELRTEKARELERFILNIEDTLQSRPVAWGKGLS
jgi:hypothetical protein